MGGGQIWHDRPILRAQYNIILFNDLQFIYLESNDLCVQ